MPLVQTASIVRSVGGSSVATFASAVAAGNTLIAVCSNYDGGFTSATGSRNGLLAAAVQEVRGTNNYLQILYRLIASSGTEAVTFTGGSYIVGVVMEWSGIATSGALDATGTTTAGPVVTATTPNTTDADVVICGYVANQDSANIGYGTPATGYTLADVNNNSATNTGYLAAWKVASGIETSSATASPANIPGTALDGVIATFKAASINITIALTGNAAAAVQGGLGVQTPAGLTWDNGVTWDGGVLWDAPSSSITIALAGIEAAATAGDLGSNRARALTSISAAAGAGSLGTTRTIGLAGSAASADAGSVTTAGEAAAQPGGVSAAASVGAPAVSGEASKAVAGVAATSAAGSALAAGSAAAGPAGVSAQSAVGPATASGGVVVPGNAVPGGVAATSAVGQAQAIGAARVTASGVSASALTGNAAAAGAALATPLGVFASASVGSVASSSAGIATPAGVFAAAAVGQVVASATAFAAAAGVSASAFIGQANAFGAAIAMPLGMQAATAVASFAIQVDLTNWIRYAVLAEHRTYKIPREARNWTLKTP